MTEHELNQPTRINTKQSQWPKRTYRSCKCESQTIPIHLGISHRLFPWRPSNELSYPSTSSSSLNLGQFSTRSTVCSNPRDRDTRMFHLCSATILGCESSKKVSALSRNLIFGSVSSSMSFNLSTACRTIFSWEVLPWTTVQYTRIRAILRSSFPKFQIMGRRVSCLARFQRCQSTECNQFGVIQFEDDVVNNLQNFARAASTFRIMHGKFRQHCHRSLYDSLIVIF